MADGEARKLEQAADPNPNPNPNPNLNPNPNPNPNPSQAARAWKEYTEDRGGKVYYFNAQTKVSTYTKPAGFK